MKQLKFLLASLAILFAGGAWAQTAVDVTDDCLNNADFSQSTPLTGDLRGYGKDVVEGDSYGFQAVEGWDFIVLQGDNATPSYPNSGMGGGVFAYGSASQVRGNNKTAPATDPDGNPGNCLAFFGVWSCGGYYYQEVTFQPGEYTITIPVYCPSGTQNNTTYIGFIPNSGTAQTFASNPAVGQWTTYTKTFTLTSVTGGKIALGYKSIGKGSGDNPMLFFDKVTILYKATVIKDVLEEAIEMDKWNGSAATFSTTQTVSLPAGDYVFMTPGRGVKGIPVTMTVGEMTVSYPTKGDVGYGIDVDGKANFSPEGTYANNNQGRGWEWRYVPVTLAEAGDVTVTLTLNLNAGTWGSFGDLMIFAKPSPSLVKDELYAAIQEATAIRQAQDYNAIVDEEPFQYSIEACNTLTEARSAAVSVYNNASSKTMAEIVQATADLLAAIETFNNSELVAPDYDALYNLVLTDEDFAHAGKPITFKKGNESSGGYYMGYTDNPGSPYNQDIMFEAAEGVNCYYMYIKDYKGDKMYVCTGSTYSGGNDYQLRITDTKENALVLKAERKYNVLSFINTETNSYVGSNGDEGFYTSDNNHKFEIRDFVTTQFTLKVADGKTVQSYCRTYLIFWIFQDLNSSPARKLMAQSSC